jgi:hypothetical protein
MRRELIIALWLSSFAVTAAGDWAAPADAHAAERRPGRWTGGAGLGFLGNTPDGTAFALNGHAETFFAERLSVGPLLQLGFTGDSTQVGLSGQVKYWIDLDPRLALTVQGGAGFVYNSFRDDDTSWLIPLGFGVDYALTSSLNLTGTFLLNFTDLDTGRGSGRNVMPGLTFGVRF